MANLFGSLKKLVSMVFSEDGQDVKVEPNNSVAYTGPTVYELPPIASGTEVLVGATATQTLSNKILQTPLFSGSAIDIPAGSTIGGSAIGSSGGGASLTGSNAFTGPANSFTNSDFTVLNLGPSSAGPVYPDGKIFSITSENPSSQIKFRSKSGQDLNNYSELTLTSSILNFDNIISNPNPNSSQHTSINAGAISLSYSDQTTGVNQTAGLGPGILYINSTAAPAFIVVTGSPDSRIVINGSDVLTNNTGAQLSGATFTGNVDFQGQFTSSLVQHNEYLGGSSSRVQVSSVNAVIGDFSSFLTVALSPVLTVATGAQLSGATFIGNISSPNISSQNVMQQAGYIVLDVSKGAQLGVPNVFTASNTFAAGLYTSIDAPILLHGDANSFIHANNISATSGIYLGGSQVLTVATGAQLSVPNVFTAPNTFAAGLSTTSNTPLVLSGDASSLIQASTISATSGIYLGGNQVLTVMDGATLNGPNNFTTTNTFQSIAIQSATTLTLPTDATAITVTGSIRYDTTINKLQFFNGTAWETVTSI